jgi:hypothetical protein
MKTKTVMRRERATLVRDAPLSVGMTLSGGIRPLLLYGRVNRSLSSDQSRACDGSRRACISCQSVHLFRS